MQSMRNSAAVCEPPLPRSRARRRLQFVRATSRCARAHEAERPPLELVRVLRRETRRLVGRHRLADDPIRLLDFLAEGAPQPGLDEVHCEVRYVDPQPTPPERLRRCNRRPAAAERIEHEVSLIRAGADDAFEKSLGLLRRIPETFGRP